LKSECGPIPQVEWWKFKDHESVAGFVHRQHKGDWKPYIDKWFKRLVILQDMQARGSTAITRTGVRLNGKDLQSYIDQMMQRLTVIRCLAQEARAYRLKQSRMSK
jgi:hypothetical protein